MHELGTNANKYGALSAANGNVDLSWETAESGKMLKLRWQERGGPAVSEPTRHGFGTFIIEQSLSGLDGEAHIRFDPAGLVCDMWLPIRKTKHPANEKE